MRMGIVTPAVFVLLALAVPAARAGVVIDTRPGTGAVGIGTSDWVGQTFTALGDTLVEFGFLLEDTGADDLFFSGAVYATDGTVATGLPLYTSSPVEVTTPGTYLFTPYLTLTSGTLYAIAAEVTAGDGSFRGTPANIYSGGTFIYNAGAGTPWYSNPGDDGAIVISMTPEPATVLLFGLGLAAAAAVVRRRRHRS